MRGRNMMRCQELVELVTEYLEGILPRKDHNRLEEHMATCQGCRNYVRQMRTVIRTLARFPRRQMPGRTRTRLLRVFRDWKRSAARRSR